MKEKNELQVFDGKANPLGASQQVVDGKAGVNFALFSTRADTVTLCLFAADGNERRYAMSRSADEPVWHIFIAGLTAGAEYGFRLSGEGLNPQKLMLDPYARIVRGKPDYQNEAERSYFSLQDERDNGHLAPKAVVSTDDFDWEDDKFPRTPWAETIIYELHVKGFSKLKTDLPASLRGTYAGLAHPNCVNYLKRLGITAVELLPIAYHINDLRVHYWGYNPLAMFAVESDYYSGAANSSPLTEFKQMVKTLHAAGIEVILDMVFNHSAESEKQFPTYSQRGIDEQYYYWHDHEGNYLNWTGCGNMLNVSRQYGRRWVIDCLKYWVEQCRVDGFRFDLATTLGRETPDFRRDAQLFQDILNEPSLQNCKFIAEPWDIGPDGYQLGNFPAYFAEWNDQYRDDIRRFWLWKSGEVNKFADRLAGSSAIFNSHGRLPYHSINFITAHDGFTLHDLVSYNEKHNERNGEHNHDGTSLNYSYNHGVEGDDGAESAVLKNRVLTKSNLLMTLLLSNGTPMLLAGDEFGNSQYGNNNAYCQDNEISWLKWNDADHSLFTLISQTIAMRKQIAGLINNQWWNEANVRWLNMYAEPMSLSDWQDRTVGAMQILLDGQWLMVVNTHAQARHFILPPGRWRCRQSGSDELILGECTLDLSSGNFCLLQLHNEKSKA
ncbi:glycogen debranching protein GlgX [Pasteurellaceae bacterium LIM206]|nr:glycogen debranching protein GlgX [Pasteurellaceae bacterium LIM206]